MKTRIKILASILTSLVVAYISLRSSGAFEVYHGYGNVAYAAPDPIILTAQ